MTDETAQAFDHPEARARAMADAAHPRDRISLRDHVVEVEIGAFQEERGTMQRVAFNVVVEVRPAGVPLDDDVDRILSYDTITEAIAHELAAERLNLLETLAERIAERILAAPLAERVFVRVEKLDRGPGALGVEIVRGRAEVKPHDEEPVHPVVWFLGDIADPALPGFIDRLAADGRPAILCTGAAPAPQAGQPMAQRRIDLLAIEQAAWQLAARDARCFVVATRTELDWAMKNGRISVWAPSKLVLDAVDGPKGPVDPVALAAWLAGELEATEMVIAGAEQIPECPVPVRAAALSGA